MVEKQLGDAEKVLEGSVLAIGQGARGFNEDSWSSSGSTR